MKILFGPVSSRRFGLSLGVDLSPLKKQCNFDCVYCELVRAKPVRMQDEVVSVEQIVKEVKEALQKGIAFDYLTLTANGEPSLYPHLKELVYALKTLLHKKKILILSNGTAVLDQFKFKTLLDIDVVKFSLDSAISKTFHRIDKALRSIDLSLMIEKMAEFRMEFKGELVMEILVVAGINDNEIEFNALNEALSVIAPTRVDISTIDRPPAYPVKAVSEERLKELALCIDCVPVLLPKRYLNEQKIDFTEDELLKMFHLRPQSELDIEMKLSPKSKKIVQKLFESGAVKMVDLAGVKFYRV
ncbi:radical SAM protein [Campylobacter sp. MIT 21-1685]|uniref:radical SAM protein n=1 Tax=unclassified Campylobacter TaxID=2593542 RepID=UPI00224B7DB3|nr:MULTISPECIES: radical SAM protein [unclassified Campylobacter]MCX2682493.1 radical SAM protein [Campylobacter sp. MIT 21-1684]MCX2750794.1 radical SAM protein [Campylobacter sp. MIT 21-1682]MCX2806974.1 radical SAM protein [Campylobacter sp. MIT 21-1685]